MQETWSDSNIIENLHDEIPREEVRQLRDRPDIESIVEAVSAVFEVAEEDIYRVKRGRGNKNTPRKVAMYLAQNEGDYRLTGIADAFGLNHYGGVSFAIQSFTKELLMNKQLVQVLKLLTINLTPNSQLGGQDQHVPQMLRHERIG